MSNDTERFFELLHGRAPKESRITLWSLPSKRSEHLPPEPALLARRALELDAQSTEGVFVGVCPRVGDLGPHRRGGISDVVQLPALWADIDVAHPTHAAENLPPDIEAAFGLVVESGLPEPSVVVWSGGGIHPYWILKDPLELDTRQASPTHLLGRALQERVRAVAERRGWHLDAVANVDRVLRVPGTWNRKGDHRRACGLIEVSDRVYNVSDLVVHSIGPVPTSASTRPTVPGPSPHPPDGPGPVERTKLGPEALTLAKSLIVAHLRTLTNDKTRDLGRLIAEGRPLVKGERDNELTRAASIVAALAPDECEAEELVDVLYPTVDATAKEESDHKNPAPTRANALDKLKRQLKDFRRKKAVAQAASKSLVAGLIRAARAPGRQPGEKFEDIPTGQYTNDEIRKFEHDHGYPLQWIIQREGAYYVLMAGAYHGPYVISDLSVKLKEALAPTKLDLTVWENSNLREMRTSEILDKYSVVADKVIAKLTIPSSSYDRETKIFYESAAPMRKIAPTFHASIDAWLRVLGGRYADKLLDWIACVTLLNWPCTALYLAKCPATGKSLLASGLSRIWTIGAPVSLKNIVGSWNTDLLRCPLVIADEYLPPQWLERGKNTASSELRELVAAQSRMLTRKFMPNADLVGHVRVMLMSNDRSMIPYDEQLGTNDVKAVAGRFLTINTSEEAARYIESIGGREGGTSGWVERDEIAEHALWLRDNRKVVPGARFIVDGVEDDTQTRLVYGTRIGSPICEIITKILGSNQPPLGGGPPAVRAGDGRVLVSTIGIAESWKDYVNSDHPASVQKIGKQLSTLSGDRKEKVNGQPYWCVNPKYVLGWAEENWVGDVSAIETKINTPGDGGER